MDGVVALWRHSAYGQGQLYWAPGRPHDLFTLVGKYGVRIRFSLYSEMTTDEQIVLADFLTHLAAARSGQLGGYTFEVTDKFTDQLRDDLAALAVYGRHRVHREFGQDFVVHADARMAGSGRDFFPAPPTAEEIERAVVENTAYRRVLYTAPDRSLQLVAMSADPLIPREVHPDVAQYFLVKRGEGVFEVDGRAENVARAAARWVMPGQRHMVASTTRAPLKVFVTYAPAHHPAGRVDQFNVDLLTPDAD